MNLNHFPCYSHKIASYRIVSKIKLKSVRWDGLEEQCMHIETGPVSSTIKIQDR